MVEFVPANCVAPAGDGAGGLVGLAGVVPGIFEGFVGGHGGQDCCCWLGVWRVGVGRGLRVEVEVLDDERGLRVKMCVRNRGFSRIDL